MAEITFAEISLLLKYEPKTGKLYWMPRPLSMFSCERMGNTWNSRYADKAAFTTVSSNGYLNGSALNRRFSAHRICWLLHYGEWPKGHLDHINGVRDDNRIENLRDVTRSQNSMNLCIGTKNTSGYLGICWDKRRTKWEAHIKVDQKKISLGRFAAIEDAILARKDAEKKYGFHPNHGKEHREYFNSHRKAD